MVNFEPFLNTIIPIGVFIFFAFILGRALKEPLGALFNFIKGLFAGKEEVRVIGGAISYE